MKKVCPICKQQADEEMIQLCRDADAWIIATIRRMHPQWIEEDGGCSKCVEYYKGLGKSTSADGGGQV